MSSTTTPAITNSSFCYNLAKIITQASMGSVRVECLLTSDFLEEQWLERDEGVEVGSEDGGRGVDDPQRVIPAGSSW